VIDDGLDTALRRAAGRGLARRVQKGTIRPDGVRRSGSWVSRQVVGRVFVLKVLVWRILPASDVMGVNAI
jgi:hypothetical protein